MYAKLFNELILRIASSGLDLKINGDLAWDLQRGDSSKLDTKTKSSSMATVEERKLNLADTEGMFLLMAIGYIVAGSVLFSEIVGGCAKSCRAFIRRSSVAEGDSRRPSVLLAARIQSNETRSFTDKLKHNIRRRLRSKAMHDDHDVQNEVEETNEQIKSEVTNVPKEPLDAPELKGPISFCTLKRIMLMRKHRKEKKNANQENSSDENASEVKGQSQAHKLENKLEHHIEIDDGAGGNGVSNVSIGFERNSDFYDDVSLIASSSIYSDTQAIKEETEAEVNQLTIDSGRGNNPSKEFGDLV